MVSDQGRIHHFLRVGRNASISILIAKIIVLKKSRVTIQYMSVRMAKVRQSLSNQFIGNFPYDLNP
jgi:hypothetical protein